MRVSSEGIYQTKYLSHLHLNGCLSESLQWAPCNASWLTCCYYCCCCCSWLPQTQFALSQYCWSVSSAVRQCARTPEVITISALHQQLTVTVKVTRNSCDYQNWGWLLFSATLRCAVCPIPLITVQYTQTEALHWRTCHTSRKVDNVHRGEN